MTGHALEHQQELQCNKLAIMASIAEKVKETLIGTDEEPQLSDQTRQDFLARALTDAETGEHYLGQQEFIDAVAPVGEDYVGEI